MSQGSIPIVSVIMPAYNAERYIVEAIDSILCQSFSNFELIVINDGSIDNTEKIILDYAACDCRVVYLKNEANRGICVTLNKGLDAARGKYIARMDADDISLPQRLEKQVKFMDAHHDVAVCGSDIVVFGDGIEPYTFAMVADPDQCSAGLLFNSCFAHPSVMWRAQIMHNEHLRYDNNSSGFEDFQLWWVFARYGKLCNLSVPLLKYRKHKNQITNNYSNKVKEKLYDFCFQRYGEFGVPLGDNESAVVNDYSLGCFDRFNVDKFLTFAGILRRVVNQNKYPIITSKKAMKIVAARAIAYTIYQSPQLSNHKIQCFVREYCKGMIPTIMFLKYIKACF